MKTEPIFSQLHQQVNKMLTLNQKEWDAFTGIFVFRSVPKKFNLVRVGDVSREAYFINKGAARLYFEKEGEEISANFMFENSFIASLESFLLQTPSRQAIDTLEGCELLVLSKQRLDELIQTYPKFHIFSKAIAEMAFIMLQRRASSFILDSPEERYMNMLQQRPEILERVPQHMIASYLGVTPVSLSRIRKRIS
ncbi:MAG TPA: Crp/Fnr family transcriptional regulator [Chitinophagales bacterium]|nr:Crp/Fnr family transcriptional regulator [Chitinophagales bacterium]